MIFEVKGMLAPVFTPFMESGSMDLSVIPIYMAYLNKHQVNGILGGTTGEGMSLSLEERKSLLETWVSVARPFGTKVIAQVGGAPFPDVLELKNKAMTKDEIQCLVELIESNKIITSKETNATNNKLKDEAWVSLTAAFNARNGSIPRQKDQLKSKWDNLKKAARKRTQQIRMNRLKAKHAEKLKADGIMTLPELYYKPKTIDQLVRYLQGVSEAAPTLPLIYYHFPMMTGVDVNMRQFFDEATSKLPNFKGAKADLGVADQVADLLGEDQKIFIANHHIAPSVLMGHDSSIATITNLFPDLVHNIVETVKKEEVQKAKVLQQRLSELVVTIASLGDFVPAMKATMELVTGIRVGQPRPPLGPLNSEQRKRLRDALLSLDVQLQEAV